MSETPFLILITYLAFATIIFFAGLIMGIRRISGAPFMCIFSGILIFGMLAITDDISGEGLTGNQTQSIIQDTTHWMNQNTEVGSGSALFAGSTIFSGQRVDNDNSLLALKEINQATFVLDRDGTITSGNIYAGVWNRATQPTSTNYLFLFGQMEASHVTVSTATYQFTRNDSKTWVLTPHDTVGIFFNGGSSGNQINMHHNTTASSFDGVNSYCASTTTTTWTDTTTCDRRMKISLVTDQANEKDEPYDFNQWDTYVYLTFMSVFYIITGVIFQMRDWGK